MIQSSFSDWTKCFLCLVHFPSRSHLFCVHLCVCLPHFTAQHRQEKSKAKNMTFRFVCFYSPVCVFYSFFCSFFFFSLCSSVSLAQSCDGQTGQVDSCHGLFYTSLSQGWWLMALRSTHSRKSPAVRRLPYMHIPSPCILSVSAQIKSHAWTLC